MWSKQLETLENFVVNALFQVFSLLIWKSSLIVLGFVICKRKIMQSVKFGRIYQKIAVKHAIIRKITFYLYPKYMNVTIM